MSKDRRQKLGEEKLKDIYREQRGRCGVCDARITLSAALDHDHDTDEDRGLLCVTCNIAEGAIKRSGLTVAEFAAALTAYLNNPPALRARRGCWAILNATIGKIVDGNYFIYGRAQDALAFFNEQNTGRHVIVVANFNNQVAAPRTILHHSHQVVRGASAPFAPSALEEGANSSQKVQPT